MTFNPTIYSDPEERADARERYYAFDDERAESEREFRHEREMEIPNPMHPGENSLMFDVPASVPKWRELMERHGIFAHHAPHEESGVAWTAWYFGSLEGCEPKWREMDPMDLVAGYCRLVDDMGHIEYASTEREAVVALIHRLKLEGWETVSAR